MPLHWASVTRLVGGADEAVCTPTMPTATMAAQSAVPPTRSSVVRVPTFLLAGQHVEVGNLQQPFRARREDVEWHEIAPSRDRRFPAPKLAAPDP